LRIIERGYILYLSGAGAALIEVPRDLEGLVVVSYGEQSRGNRKRLALSVSVAISKMYSYPRKFTNDSSIVAIVMHIEANIHTMLFDQLKNQSSAFRSLDCIV